MTPLNMHTEEKCVATGSRDILLAGTASHKGSRGGPFSGKD